MERIKLLISTIKTIKQALLSEEDPRQREDYADTLDRLEHSLDYEVDQYTKLLEQQQNKAA